MGNQFGYINGDWRAQGINLNGLGTPFDETISAPITVGTNIVLSGLSVPLNTIFRIEAINAWNASGVSNLIYHWASSPTTTMTLALFQAVAVGFRTVWTGLYTLPPTGRVQAYISGAIGDVCNLRYSGFYVPLDK